MMKLETATSTAVPINLDLPPIPTSQQPTQQAPERSNKDALWDIAKQWRSDKSIQIGVPHSLHRFEFNRVQGVKIALSGCSFVVQPDTFKNITDFKFLSLEEQRFVIESLREQGSPSADWNISNKKRFLELFLDSVAEGGSSTLSKPSSYIFDVDRGKLVAKVVRDWPNQDRGTRILVTDWEFRDRPEKADAILGMLLEGRAGGPITDMVSHKFTDSQGNPFRTFDRFYQATIRAGGCRD